MKTIKVEKSELIDILEKNKKVHIKEFKDTWSGYKEDVQSWMEKQVLNLRSNKDFEVRFEGTMPYSNEEDYTKILGMLELSVDTEVDLTTEEYTSYVQDDWEWKHHFSAMNSTYSKV